MNSLLDILSRAGIPSLPPTGTPLDTRPRPVTGHPGKSVVDYLLSNIVGPGMMGNIPNFGTEQARTAPDFAWHNRRPGEEGIYADPLRADQWLMGEIEPPGTGLVKKGAMHSAIASITRSDIPLTEKAYRIADLKPDKNFLLAKQREAIALSESLRKQDKFQEAMDVASEHQMWREAIEKLEGAPQHN